MEFLLYLPLGPAGSRKPPRLSIILHFYRFCKYQIFVGTAGFSGPDCQKIAFLPYCVCRGDHWSPANLPQQRIFPGGLLTRQTGTGEHCSPLQEFFDSLRRIFRSALPDAFYCLRFTFRQRRSVGIGKQAAVAVEPRALHP